MLDAIKDISEMPPIDVLRSRFQSLAMLDAILMADWEWRYFSFNSKWGRGEMMASMRNGEGDEYFFLFCGVGVVGKIYSREKEKIQSSQKIIANVPPQFDSFLTEAAFRLEETTFCLWQSTGTSKWEISPPLDCGIPLLAFIQDNGEHYRRWAEEYYEREIPFHLVEAIFAHQPLTDQLLASFKEERTLKDLATDTAEIGYP